jgi:DNA-directed RNA polymerase specialized sigma24 family protein
VSFGVACPASRVEPSSSAADAMGNDDDRDPKAAIRAAWRRFLGRADVYAWVHKHVAAKVDAYHAPEVAGDALTEAIGVTSLPDSDVEGVLWAWLRTIVDRGIADFHEKRTTRKKYQGDMPPAPVKVDEAGEPVDTTYDDDIEDRDPSYDPRAPDRRVEGFFLRQYLKLAVKGNTRDAETLSWILQWTDEGKGYQEIADAAGLSRAKVEARVHRFKHKYFARYEKWRDRAIVLLVLLGALLLVALLAWLLNRPKQVENPTQEPSPVPADAATVLAPLPEFDNAWPTQPGDASAPKPDKPPVVR